ncbi:MAG TPA: hypothetical protein VJC07_01270 [Candidatus Nanoarchaeia archaeon]|nr:hypothetical protein [Candidatus Nanoarchaeia archaeon]
MIKLLESLAIGGLAALAFSGCGNADSQIERIVIQRHYRLPDNPNEIVTQETGERDGIVPAARRVVYDSKDMDIEVIMVKKDGTGYRTYDSNDSKRRINMAPLTREEMRNYLKGEK